MPRYARTKSKTGIYHIMVRGINKQIIFREDKDKYFFLRLLADCKEETNFRLYAYCIMDNHVHLAIKDENNALAVTMKKINVAYAKYFNKKYERVGHLFQNRFGSQNIENDEYFLNLLRYVHKNPIVAGMVKKLDDYQWSSFNEYMGQSVEDGLTDVDFALKFFSEEREKAIKAFRAYCEMPETRAFLDVNEHEEKKRIGKLMWRKMYQQKIKRREIMEYLLTTMGLSIREIAEITDINWMKVARILKK